MTDIQLFKNKEFGDLNIITIDGKEYFPATACAKMLGYVEPQKAIRTHCKGVFKMDTPTAGGTQEVNYIPEGDLYRLIIRSKLPAAERFERWVFDEVLPTIRKQGAYFVLESSASKQFLSDIIVETIKQIIPLVSHNVQTSLDIAGTEQMPRKRRRHKVIDGIIERIDPSLRRMVDEMLGESDRYTYCDIAEFLQNHGISISGTSVQRYYFRMLARAQPELMSCNQEPSNTSVVPIIIQMPPVSGKS